MITNGCINYMNAGRFWHAIPDAENVFNTSLNIRNYQYKAMLVDSIGELLIIEKKYQYRLIFFYFIGDCLYKSNNSCELS